MGYVGMCGGFEMEEEAHAGLVWICPLSLQVWTFLLDVHPDWRSEDKSMHFYKVVV